MKPAIMHIPDDWLVVMIGHIREQTLKILKLQILGQRNCFISLSLAILTWLSSYSYHLTNSNDSYEYESLHGSNDLYESTITLIYYLLTNLPYERLERDDSRCPSRMVQDREYWTSIINLIISLYIMYISISLSFILPV